MTVMRATTTRPLLRDVRSARVRERVCETSRQAAWTGSGRPRSLPMTRAGVNGGRTVSPISTRQSCTTAASLAVGPL